MLRVDSCRLYQRIAFDPCLQGVQEETGASFGQAEIVDVCDLHPPRQGASFALRADSNARFLVSKITAIFDTFFG